MILKFSKYKGQDLKDVAKKDPSFALWFIRTFSYKVEVFEIAEEIASIANNYRA